jgi:hypothetical protein
MKKDQINKDLYSRVRLRPIAKRFSNDVEIGRYDDDWIIDKVSEGGVEINDTRSGYRFILGFDHIHSYISDPNRNYDGLKHGILVLKVQLFININTWKVSIEPTERPGVP